MARVLEALLLLLSVELSVPAREEVRWAVKIAGGSSREALARQLAEERGMEFVGPVHPFPGVYELRLPHRAIELGSVEVIGRMDSPSVEDAVHTELSGHPEVEWVSRQVALKRTKRDFSDPAFPKQWHLVNRQEKGHDTNVSGVWEEGVTGAGVTVAVVDDGVEWLNPDLINNYNADGSHDYNDNDKDPSPNLKAKYDNSHGTKCAGLIAAGTNDICGVGVAYGAKVAGIRMLDGMVTDMLEGKSFIYKAHVNWIYSCSWGPEDDGKTVEGPGYVAREAMELAIRKGRYGYGNVFVFASGNGGINGDNCNFDGYANSIYTITIGAVDELNSMPYYAELCSAILAVTYSNGHSRGDRMVVTTDASSHSGCTYSFSGTSASAPIASGIIALMLQTRNCLTWRDVQHIVVYTAVMVDAGHAQWAKNAAGFHHSNQHGFGLLDAYRMTRVAGLWPLVPPPVNWISSESASLSLPLTSSQPTILTRNVTRDELPHDLKSLEHVTVTLSLSHTYRGLLSIFLISPHGTNSTLATPRKQDRSGEGLKGWNFSTVRFWAESPLGQWTLVFSQSGGHDDSGLIRSWTLTLHGSAIDREDVLLRQRLVEEAVDTPTWNPLPCPTLPAHPQELHLPELDTPLLPVWKQVLLVIGCVLVFVLAIHCVGECVWERVKAQRRTSASLPAVSYSRLSGQGDDVTEGVVTWNKQLSPEDGDHLLGPPQDPLPPPSSAPTPSPSPLGHASPDSHVTHPPGEESEGERDDITGGGTPEEQPLLP